MARFVATKKDREGRAREINNKVNEVKVYIQGMKDDSNELKGKLKNYEFENNDMNDNLGEKEENIDSL